MYARPMNHELKMMAKMVAATGGMLSNWLLGRRAKPKFVMMVGRYQANAFVPKFIRPWQAVKLQTTGLRNACQASFVSQFLSLVTGAFRGRRASMNSCSRGVSHDLLRFDLGKSGRTQKMTKLNITVATPSMMNTHLQAERPLTPSIQLMP